jgi:cytochrome oxidase assembly protein ShyY1
MTNELDAFFQDTPYAYSEPKIDTKNPVIVAVVLIGFIIVMLTAAWQLVPTAAKIKLANAYDSSYNYYTFLLSVVQNYSNNLAWPW